MKTGIMPDDIEDAQEGGGRPKTVDDDVFVDAVRESGISNTSAVRERVAEKTDWDLSQMTALRRLNELAERGEVVKKLEGRSAEWMLPETFETVVPDEIFLEAIDSLGGIQTVEEIAEKVGYNETAVLNSLQRLEREGRVTSRNANGNGDTLWIVSE
jgi:Fic family protein